MEDLSSTEIENRIQEQYSQMMNMNALLLNASDSGNPKDIEIAKRVYQAQKNVIEKIIERLEVDLRTAKTKELLSGKLPRI